jgi:hypothetical protein
VLPREPELRVLLESPLESLACSCDPSQNSRSGGEHPCGDSTRTLGTPWRRLTVCR